MFKLKTLIFFLCPFFWVLSCRAAEGDSGGVQGASAAPAQAAAPVAPAVDVDALKAATKAEASAEFLSKFKEATGFESLEAFTQEKLKADGKLKELADANAAQAKSWETKYRQSAIGSALMSAASDAVDPGVVAELLKGQCQCDENGVVTVSGKPVADAVKALLTEKPFLAKAQGGTGSGAGQSGRLPEKTLTRADFDKLDAGQRSKFLADGGALID